MKQGLGNVQSVQLKWDNSIWTACSLHFQCFGYWHFMIHINETNTILIYLI